MVLHRAACLLNDLAYKEHLATFIYCNFTKKKQQVGDVKGVSNTNKEVDLFFFFFFLFYKNKGCKQKTERNHFHRIRITCRIYSHRIAKVKTVTELNKSK